MNHNWVYAERYAHDMNDEGVMRKSILLLITTLSAGLVTSAMAEEEIKVALSSPVSSKDFSYDEILDGFSMIGVEDYDADALGFRLRYLADMPSSVHVDVYVYPITLRELASLADVLEFEQMRVDAEINHAWDTADGAPTLIESYVPAGDGIFRAGLMSFRQVRKDDMRMRSHTFLSINHDLIFKIRMTVEGEEWVRGEFQNVVDQVSGALRISERPADDLGIVVTRTVFEVAGKDKPCVAGAWIAYGGSLHKALEGGHYLDSFQRELEARRAALDSWENLRREKVLRGCDSRYFANMAKAREQGFLKEYVFSTYARAYWSEPEGLRMSEYESWARSALRRHQPVEFPGVLVRWSNAED